MKTAAITGITGQDGAYLSKLLLDKGYRVVGLRRMDSVSSTRNLDYLGITDRIEMLACDLLVKEQIEDTLISAKPDEVYNLAAQSSVGNSFSKPFDTIFFNSISVLNILESIKEIGEPIKFYQASSSEMYGMVHQLPITETTPMHPRSPYGVSKATSHWLTINYRESYGLFACCGILFNHESYLRSRDFFVKKLIRESLKISRTGNGVLRLGNLNVKRDFGYSPCYVDAMWRMLQLSKPEDFVVCSGKSVSLHDIVGHVLEKLNIGWDKVVFDKSLQRPSEIEDIYGDNSKAKKILGWTYEYEFTDILDKLIDEERHASECNSF